MSVQCALPVDLAVIGAGSMDLDASMPVTCRPRFGVRYADPVAWAITALAEASWPATAADRPPGERVGVIYVGDSGPATTASDVRRATDRGEASPLRFPAAMPASIVGTVCIVLGLRGPTLTITSSVRSALQVAFIAGGGWLRRNIADAVVTIAHEDEGSGARLEVVIVGRR